MLSIISTLKEYNQDDVQADLRAGLTTAIMLIPQSMAYAMLAGLNPVHGLYAATVPTAIYALMGRSRALAVGPVALDSLLVALAVTPLAGNDPIRYALYATTLMFMMGTIQFLMGLLGFGKLSNLLRPPVLIGFTGAAALIIASTQVPTFLSKEVQLCLFFYGSYLVLSPKSIFQHSYWVLGVF
jgi:SulP family sulfate permease